MYDLRNIKFTDFPMNLACAMHHAGFLTLLFEIEETSKEHIKSEMQKLVC